MEQIITIQVECAGIDVGKASLDIAVTCEKHGWRVANTAAGHTKLIKVLKDKGIGKVGLEATGGYEAPVVMALRAAGLTVIVFQPRQIQAFGLFKLKRAKSDRIDAKLIAECTRAQDKVWDAPDPRLAPFAEHLTFIEQIREDIRRAKTRREHFHDERYIAMIDDEIARLKALEKAEMKRLSQDVRRHGDLAKRLDLVLSIEGIGEPTALALIIRMPELGCLSREEAASLLGVAPHAHDSGSHKDERHIAGGRARARTSVFAAAQAAARQWNPALIALYDRLIAKGKSHNVAIIACVRKLIIYANTVLARGEPWVPTRKPASVGS